MTPAGRRRPPTRRSVLVALAAAALFVSASQTPAVAGAPSERTGVVALTVLHAIPLAQGGQAVDVYAGNRLIASALTPGSLASLTIKPGRYDITVVADGTKPATTAPLLRTTGTRLRAGENVTLAAHLTSAGAPVISAFVNNTATVGMGQGRVTVRNIAAGPAFDVLVGRSVMATGVRNGSQAQRGVFAGQYTLRIVSSATGTPLVNRVRATIVNRPGRQDMGNNVIVYVWGAGRDGALQHVSQSIPLDLT